MNEGPTEKKYDTNPLDKKVADRAEAEMELDEPFDTEGPTRPMSPEMADLNRGDISPVRALASPKYHVEGRKTLLLQMMRSLNMWNEIAASVEVEYEHDEA